MPAFVLVVLFLLSSTTQARPVSYPSGWTAMAYDDVYSTTLHIHYTPSIQYSVGYKYERWSDKQYTMNAVQINHLARRWNTKNSQANLYFKVGLGVSSSDNNDQASHDLAGFIGLSADWEDRRYFISYENRHTEPGVTSDFFHQSLRLGWAPYEGDYGDLHTWLMVQLNHKNDMEDKFSITAIARFFKGFHLIETGINDLGEPSVNYIFRF